MVDFALLESRNLISCKNLSNGKILKFPHCHCVISITLINDNITICTMIDHENLVFMQITKHFRCRKSFLPELGHN